MWAFALTGIPLLAALAWQIASAKPGTVREVLAAVLQWNSLFLWAVLLAAWLAGLLADVVGADKPTTVTVYAASDLVIVIVGSMLRRGGRSHAEAHVVSTLSLALFCGHVVNAATKGAVSWPIYAGALNAVFVLQCLIVGGFMNDLVNRADHLLHRFRLVRIGSGGR